jgi:hypothetical protein
LLLIHITLLNNTLLKRIFRQVTFLRPVSAVSGILTDRQGNSPTRRLPTAETAGASRGRADLRALAETGQVGPATLILRTGLNDASLNSGIEEWRRLMSSLESSLLAHNFTRVFIISQAGKRSGAWVKYKVNKSQEFVIGGYTPGNPLDSVIVGYYERRSAIHQVNRGKAVP